MPAASGQVPVLECVRAGAAFVVQNFRALLGPILGGAVGLALGSVIAGAARGSSGLLIAGMALQLIVVGSAYASFLTLALKKDAPRAELGADSLRLLGAMTILSFFLGLLALLGLMVGLMALASTLAPYQADMAAAQDDPVATQALAARILEENPAPTFTLVAIFTAAWMALTSRLYLVAPATIAEGRIRVFETWPWTKGAMLRIAAARILLIWSGMVVLVFAQAGAELLLRAGAPSWVGLPLVGVFSVMSMVIYAAEAGLSAYIYRGLRPS